MTKSHCFNQYKQPAVTKRAFLLFRIQENSLNIFLLIMAAIFWVYRLVKVFCNVLSYWEIRQFYIKALKIKMVSATPGNLIITCSKRSSKSVM